jgi:hypothetical protein
MIKSLKTIWSGHIARIRENNNAYRIVIGKTEGKRSIGMPRRRWEDNIKMYLREIEWSGMDWIDLVLANTVINFWLHKVSRNS